MRLGFIEIPEADEEAKKARVAMLGQTRDIMEKLEMRGREQVRVSFHRPVEPANDVDFWSVSDQFLRDKEEDDMSFCRLRQILN